MNFRQLTTHIITDLKQAETNLNGLHVRGKQDEIRKLENQMRELKVLVGALTEESYQAIKKYLGG